MQSKIEHQEAQILSPFCEFMQQGEEALADFLTHVGIEGEALRAGPTLADSILQHYRVGKRYDVDRVAYDLLRWPPIAARIRQLETERAEEQAAREASRMRKTRAARTSHMISTADGNSQTIRRRKTALLIATEASMSTCEQRNSIDLTWLRREGLTQPGRQSTVSSKRGNREAGSVTLLSGAHGVIVRRSAADVSTAGELLPFVTTKTRFGGRRTWLECPGCKTPRRVLYDGAGFRCRACHGLSYMTQRERPWARSVTRIQRLRERLGGSGNLSLPFPPKPKGMHWRTYRRLEQLEGRLVVAVAKQYAPAREG